MIEFLDPRAEPGAPIEPYQLRAALDAPVTIGLLANGFPDSVEFLDALARSLGQGLPLAGFRYYNKGDATSVVPDGMLETIVAESQAVVAAYGH